LAAAFLPEKWGLDEGNFELPRRPNDLELKREGDFVYFKR